MSNYVSIYLPIYLSLYLPVHLQAWIRSYSARRPQVLNLTTSKTQPFCQTSSIFELDNVKKKQFCETSSFFKVDNIKNESILRDDSYQCVLRFFESICLNYCACHEKVMPGHTKCCTCHAKSSQKTWRSEAPKCNPSQEISARTS